MSARHEASAFGHSHVFLGPGHVRNERRTWSVIALCSVMMVAEVVGGLLFGSIALIADGLHMFTHAAALGLAAIAYSYARRHAEDARFSFGTGKLGDLAGFTSAVVLVMIALLIGYEAVLRFLAPVPIQYAEAIAIAALGLGVNVATTLMLAAAAPGHAHGHHHHGHHHHGHGHHGPGPHGHGHHEHDHHGHDHGPGHHGHAHSHDGARAYGDGRLVHHDHNFRAAFVHVMADAAVSVLVIAGLALGY